MKLVIQFELPEQAQKIKQYFPNTFIMQERYLIYPDENQLDKNALRLALSLENIQEIWYMGNYTDFIDLHR